MSENPLALPTIPTAPPADADYATIHAALMQTERGRRFLTDYVRRHRHTDTEMLLRAVARIEAAIRAQRLPPPADIARTPLDELARNIAGALSEIAAIKPDSARLRKADDAGGDGVAEDGASRQAMSPATAMALNATLAAAEQIRDAAWAMRARSLDPPLCDIIEAAARTLETACKWHDVAGRREHIAVRLLGEVNERLNRLLNATSASAAVQVEVAEPTTAAAEPTTPVETAPPSNPALPPPPRELLAVLGALTEEEKIALCS